MTYPPGPGQQDPYGQQYPPAPPAYPVAQGQQYSQYPQQQDYGGYQPPPSSGLAVGSLVCGIVSLLLFWLTLLDLPLVVAAVVMGHIAVTKAKRGTGGGKGMAIGGLVTGYLGLLGAIAIFVFSVMVYTGNVNLPGVTVPTR